MRRLQRLNINIAKLWDSSSSSSDDEENSNNDIEILNDISTVPPPPPTATTTAITTHNQRHHSSSQQPIPLMDNNRSRLSLLPAFPSLHQHGVVVYRDREHLLLANIPRARLTKEQRRLREHNTFKQSFALMDHRNHNNHIPSFFLDLYQQLFTDLTRRFHVDDSILDYNYQRLFKCMAIMTDERIQHRFHRNPLGHYEQLPINEYGVALEFYLQIDVELFYMKTCSFRGARPNLSHHEGLFSLNEPQARYGMTPCHRRPCQFCFPCPQITAIRLQQQEQQQSIPVVRFLSTQKHRFVNGYEAILNCPTSCETKNIIYALICPCGQFDYIGCTSMRLSQRLFYHRHHGNRIMREFILGSKNIHRFDKQLKSQEDLVKDGMLLYRHSARCPTAMQWFLDCNPEFWWFVPMLKEQAAMDNQFYNLSPSIPNDPTSPIVTGRYTRSDLEAGTCLVDLPPLPSNDYTFSTRQCAEQFQIFKNERNLLLPNNDLDLYNATIIAVLPNNCSQPLQRIVESLFITHTEAKLNTIGHLDGRIINDNLNPYGMTENRIIIDRGNWCTNLVRRSSSLL